MIVVRKRLCTEVDEKFYKDFRRVVKRLGIAPEDALREAAEEWYSKHLEFVRGRKNGH